MISDSHSIIIFEHMLEVERTIYIERFGYFSSQIEQADDGDQDTVNNVQLSELSEGDILEKANEKNLDELLDELNGLVGMEALKADIKNLINFIKVQKIRKERGMKAMSISKHLVFMGNPGTGKTTVARLVAQIYKALGLLTKGNLVEIDRVGLVAGYVGQTAIKTDNVIEEVIYTYALECYNKRDQRFSNARLMRNLLESALAHQANRIMNEQLLTDTNISTIKSEDILQVIQPKS